MVFAIIHRFNGLICSFFELLIWLQYFNFFQMEMQQGTPSFQINISSKLTPLPVHSHQQIAIPSSAEPNTISPQNVDSIDLAAGTASHFETNEAEVGF